MGILRGVFILRIPEGGDFFEGDGGSGDCAKSAGVGIV
jgi:hypothetical protein